MLLEPGDVGPITPTVTSVSGDNVDTTIRELIPGKKYALDIAVHPPWEPGTVNVTVGVSPGNGDKHERAVNVRGSVIPRAMPVPRTLVISPDRSMGAAGRTTLRWYHAPPANIVETSCTIPDAEIKLDDVEAGQQITLLLPQAPGLVTGEHTITVKTDDPQLPEVEIPIRLIRARDPTLTGNSNPDSKRIKTQRKVFKRRGYRPPASARSTRQKATGKSNKPGASKPQNKAGNE